MRRLSLRARLTALFTVAMALVIAAIGAFVSQRAGSSLRGAIDQGLRARAVDVSNLASQADNGLSSGAGDPFASPSLSFGQLIDLRGHVFDATRGLGRVSLLDQRQIARARHRSFFVDLTVGGVPSRLFVAPISAQGQRLVLVVGTSLSAERGALRGLAAGLLLGGPIALLLASVAGYLLAGAALAPVERMRARAAGMSLEERLPVPAGDDEIARLGRTLNAMLARLQDTRDRERRFLADASHELRTPLTLLKAELELALEEGQTIASLQEALASAHEETDRLVRLAGDLLVLAQIDQGTLPIRLEEVDVVRLARCVLDRFSPSARARRRVLRLQAPERLVALVDPLRLDQALANLVDNALRHGAGAVTLEVAGAGRELELHVRDEGRGIPAAFAPHAFERFSRGPGAGHGSGSGLGLAIVAAVAHAHGGSVEIGEAADVILRLPKREITGAAPPAPGPGPQGVSGRTHRVLARTGRQAVADQDRVVVQPGQHSVVGGHPVV